MHDHHDKHLTKREKKKALLKKNRFHQEIFNFLRLRRNEEERIKKQDDARKPSAPEKKDDDKEIWSAKVASVRNRLDGSRRVSKERWNRFAGTESGGGRGL